MSKKGSSKVDIPVVIAAVKKCRGLRTRVAEMLGIARSTVQQYIVNYPEVKEFFSEVIAAEKFDKRGVPDYTKIGIKEVLK